MTKGVTVNIFKYTILAIGLLIASGCTTIHSSHQVVSAKTQWGIAPFTNNTEVPQAGNRAMSITAGLLETRGIMTLKTYKSNETCNQLIVCPNTTPSIQRVLQWGKEHHLHFVMMGSVNEWVYKVGLDGEPVASVALQLYDVNNGKMIWNAVGSKFGTSRSGLGNTGQTLINDMLHSLTIV
jgi:hypothetical protein